MIHTKSAAAQTGSGYFKRPFFVLEGKYSTAFFEPCARKRLEASGSA